MRRLYRFLLNFYPAHFREEFAGPMERQFADEYRDSDSFGARSLLCLRTFFDLLLGIPSELLRETRQDVSFAARVYRKRAVATLLALSALPLARSAPEFATLVARVHGDADRYLPLLRDAVQQVDRQVPVYDVKTLDDRLQATLAQPRFYTTAVLFFGAFALLLAVVGIYGVASYSITQRTHEIGVRIAVGASALGLRGMLLRQGLWPVACGAAAGVLGATVLGRYLQHLIAGAQSPGVLVCGAAGAVLAFAASFAIWSATGRVVRMDPTAALRAE